MTRDQRVTKYCKLLRLVAAFAAGEANYPNASQNQKAPQETIIATSGGKHGTFLK